MELVFATNNINKLEEIRALVGSSITILCLDDIGCKEELPETGYTLEDNALQKARYIYEHYKKNCFADDTGLEIVALGNAPGVYSARYAGPEKESDKNIQKVLREMDGVLNRSARFKTVISLIINGSAVSFDGVVKGEILKAKQGDKGFGYDSIFQPEGFTYSFAQLSLVEKNRISHRGKAFEKLINYLTKMS